MSGRAVTIILGIGLIVATLSLAARLARSHLPGNQQGYEPQQPIAFSHRVHAGDLQIACLYCHTGAERGRYAGMPAANICMNCHRFVTASWTTMQAESEKAIKEKRRPRQIISPELKKLYDGLALDEKIQRDPHRKQTPIAWVRVHNLPDFACFDHRAHTTAGVTCQQCHGPIEKMERVRQVENLSMGWCVNCHRDANRSGVAGKKVNASLDCSACHY